MRTVTKPLAGAFESGKNAFLRYDVCLNEDNLPLLQEVTLNHMGQIVFLHKAQNL